MNKIINNVEVSLNNYIVSDISHNIHAYENILESQIKKIQNYFEGFVIIEKFESLPKHKINHDLTEFKKTTYKYHNNNLYVASEIYNNEMIYNYKDSYIIDIKKQIIEKDVATLREYIDKFKSRITLNGKDYTFYKLVNNQFVYSAINFQDDFITIDNNKYIQYKEE